MKNPFFRIVHYNGKSIDQTSFFLHCKIFNVCERVSEWWVSEWVSVLLFSLYIYRVFVIYWSGFQRATETILSSLLFILSVLSWTFSFLQYINSSLLYFKFRYYCFFGKVPNKVENVGRHYILSLLLATLSLKSFFIFVFVELCV